MAETKSASHTRPLSPHLSIYHWHLSMALSILHRATGVGLVLGVVFFVAWIWSLVYCPDTITYFQDFGESWIGKIFLIAWTFAFYLHFMNGLRHLFWDMGAGFEINTARRSGTIVLGGALFLTFFTWYMVLAF